MKKKRNILFTVFGLTSTYLALSYFAKRSKAKDQLDESLKENAYENVGIPMDKRDSTIYEKYGKRAIDKVLSFGGLIVLAPVYALISLAIKVDDPGPVLFTQKRVGQNKTFFKLHKFRSMKMSTPHDTPTHLLENPDQYITRVGKILRKYSLDELPQVWDIFVGNISTIGPRPALWNQEDLVAQRDKYGANDVKPGLTGWAQINGRDELEIPEKAKLDGDYVNELKAGVLDGLKMDARCFFGTFASVFNHEGVVEGGTGSIQKEEAVQAGFGKEVVVDKSLKKKVLITGANSFIGTSFDAYANKNYADNFEIHTADLIDYGWRDKDFSSFDTVFHVAGIAHVDVDTVSIERQKMYYEVNTDLAVDCAKKAKAEGVRQFVFMSSMIIYGNAGGYNQKKVITKYTQPAPADFYGDSKWQADQKIRELEDENFHVVMVRPPMIYGKGGKGNYQTLSKLAKMLPIFPKVENERSMLHVDNLCEFLCQVMLVGEGGIFFPQNKEYVNTSDMMRKILLYKKRIPVSTRAFNQYLWMLSKTKGKFAKLTNKASGHCVYDKELSQYPGIDYQVVDLEKSIELSEG